MDWNDSTKLPTKLLNGWAGLIFGSLSKQLTIDQYWWYQHLQFGIVLTAPKNIVSFHILRYTTQFARPLKIGRFHSVHRQRQRDMQIENLVQGHYSKLYSRCSIHLAFKLLLNSFRFNFRGNLPLFNVWKVRKFTIVAEASPYSFSAEAKWRL